MAIVDVQAADQRLLTRRQVAAICGVSLRTVEAWGDNGPPAIRIVESPRVVTVTRNGRRVKQARTGGPVRYRACDLEAWIASRKPVAK